MCIRDRHQELEKLCAYGAGEGEITLADVDAVATRTASFTVFQLIDIAARGDIAGALRTVSYTHLPGYSPPVSSRDTRIRWAMPVPPTETRSSTSNTFSTSPVVWFR